jgi:hypothetical protein
MEVAIEFLEIKKSTMKNFLKRTFVLLINTNQLKQWNGIRTKCGCSLIVNQAPIKKQGLWQKVLPGMSTNFLSAITN